MCLHTPRPASEHAITQEGMQALISGPCGSAGRPSLKRTEGTPDPDLFFLLFTMYGHAFLYRIRRAVVLFFCFLFFVFLFSFFLARSCVRVRFGRHPSV